MSVIFCSKNVQSARANSIQNARMSGSTLNSFLWDTPAIGQSKKRRELSLSLNVHFSQKVCYFQNGLAYYCFLFWGSCSPQLGGERRAERCRWKWTFLLNSTILFLSPKQPSLARICHLWSGLPPVPEEEEGGRKRERERERERERDWGREREGKTMRERGGRNRRIGTVCVQKEMVPRVVEWVPVKAI